MADAYMSSTSRRARQAVLLSMVGSTVLLLVLVLAHVAFQSIYRQATERSIIAASLGADLRLSDERATLSAVRAVTAYDQSASDTYLRLAGLVSAGIETANRQLPGPISADFASAAKAAHASIMAIERRAIALASAGTPADGRALLDSQDHQSAKVALAKAVRTFESEHARTTSAEIARWETRSTSIVTFSILLATIGFLTVWRRLDVSLSGSRQAFAEQEAKIMQLVQADLLTGLANRRAFKEQLEKALKSPADVGRGIAVLFIDLDRFRPINDRFGYQVGDLALVETGRRIRRELSATQFLARVGGDEFVVLHPCTGRPGELEELCNRLINAISKPLRIEQQRLDLGASIGYAIAPSDTREAGELMRKADVALNKAKLDGPGAIKRYRADMDTELNERLALEADLREGLGERQFIAYFQPLVTLETGRIKGFEALARWQHPTRGLLPPSTFISIAEDRGLIRELTLCVMRSACRSARDWSGTKIAVNVAPELLRDSRIVDEIKAVLAETGFPAPRLEIEITENAIVEDIEAAKGILRALKDLGVGVALDDFGTGYASLAQLAELEFDKIKIDASFVRSMHLKRESATIIHAIVGLGKSLGRTTLAEGIETEADLARLKAIGCEEGQGYLFAKPMPEAEAAVYVATRGDDAVKAA